MAIVQITDGEYSDYYTVGHITVTSIKVVEQAITKYFSEHPDKAGEYTLDAQELFFWLEANLPKKRWWVSFSPLTVEELHLSGERERLLPEETTYVAASWWPESTYRELPEKPNVVSTTSLQGIEDWCYNVPPDNASRASAITREEAESMAETLASQHRPTYREGVSSMTTAGILKMFTRE